MKKFLGALLLFGLLMPAIGCDKAPKPPSEEERKAKETEMRAEMEKMMQQVPQRPGAGAPKAP